jgi:hypothetical protein
VSYIGNEPFSVAFLTDTFSGDGSDTTFTLSAAPATTSSILVSITGVLQDPSTYSVSGTTLTFSAAPPSGTSNISVRFLGIPASGVTTTAYRTVTEFTATAGQTSFTVPSYTVGYIDVYRNGVMLGTADFTATTGTTVVLAAGATAGDLIRTESFYVSSVLNAIPGTAGSVGTSYLVDGSVTQAKVATGVAGTGPAFSAYAGSNQTITSSTFTKIEINTEEFDTANCYNTSTYRFTPNVAGYYQVSGCINNYSSTSPTRVFATIYKNGSVYKRFSDGAVSSGTFYAASEGSALVYLNGSTDYIELYGFIVAATATIAADSAYVFFQASLVRAA